MIFFFGGIGLIFLLCCLIFIHVGINVNFEKNEKGFVFKIKADLYFIPTHKLVKCHYENLDFTLSNEFEKMKSSSQKLKERAKSDDFKAFLIKLGFRDYKQMANSVLNYTLVKEFEWKTKIGLHDAMYTGIGTGSIWAIKGMIVSLISFNSRLERLKLDVSPDYNNQIFSSNLNCIIRMRIVHIIFVAIYLIYLIVRGYFNEYRPGKAARSSDRRTYENSYAEY